MARSKLVKRLSFVGGLILLGSVLGTAAYAAKADDPAAFVTGVVLSFPAAFLLAWGTEWDAR